MLALLISLTAASCKKGTDVAGEGGAEKVKYVVTKREWDRKNDGSIDSVARYSYDESGNVIKEAFDDNNDGAVDRVEHYAYDDMGNVIEQKSVNGANGKVYMVMRHAYDYSRGVKEGPVRSEIDFNGDGVFDSVSENVRIFDGEGNVERVERRDSKKGVVSVTYPSYDSDGNLIRWGRDEDLDGKVDVVSVLSYDKGGNMVRNEYDGDNDRTVDSVSRFLYDSGGRLLKMEIDENNDGKVDLEIIHIYDENGNPLREEHHPGKGLRLLYYEGDMVVHCTTAPLDQVLKKQ